VPIAEKPADVTSAAQGVIMHPEYAKSVLGDINVKVRICGYP
jgi:hypothetical protein